MEQTTTQTEAILKDMGIIADDRLLMEAHASLDRAIKSASSLYKPQEQQDAVNIQSFTHCLHMLIILHYLATTHDNKSSIQDESKAIITTAQ